MLLIVLVGTSGCTRRFYRNQADKEAYAVLKEKDVDPRWKIDLFRVYPDPRARFADWTNPDRPPQPPDDMVTKTVSPTPQKPGHAGIAYIEGKGYLQILADWDEENRRIAAERKKELGVPPEVNDQVKKEVARKMIGAAGPSVPVIDIMAQYEMINEFARPVSQTSLTPNTNEVPPPKKRPYIITMDQSVELAVFNAREYQLKCEGLYLTALPVTLERFSFAAQGFAMGTVARDWMGPFAPQTPPNDLNGPRNSYVANQTGGVSKLFSTGALLLMQFANQTVINLGTIAGNIPPHVVSQSTATLDIVQPFLQGGGKAVTLEPLTQAERNLLYAVRDFAKYRQEFYAYITVGQVAFIPGQQAGVNTITGGTVGAPSAFIPNATPVAQSAAVPGATPQVVPGQSGQLANLPALSANPYGYMNTLLQKAQLITYIKNVSSFEYFFKLLQVYQDGGIVNPVQVLTIEQNYVKGIETMLNNWNDYRQALDLFRIQCGLPTSLPLELDDGPLQPMYDLVDRYEKSSSNFQLAVNEGMEFGGFDDAAKLRDRFHKVFSQAPLVKNLPFSKEGPARWKSWEDVAKPADIDAKIKTLKAELIKLQDLKADLELKGKLPSDAELKRMSALAFDIDLGYFEKTMRDYETQPWKKVADPKAQRLDQSKRFLQVHRQFVALLSEPMRERLEQIRQSWPALPPVFLDNVDLLGAADDTALNTVVRKALECRLDLMNQQAQMVDAWRKVKVAANALMGVFNLEYNLNATTTPGGSNPFAFSNAGTQHQLIVNWQLPIVRIAERNNYRSTLINYQQERRNWMDALDQVAFAVRFQLRNLRISAYNYHRVQKRAMELAYLIVDQSLQAFNQPLAPSGPTGIPGVGGPPATGGTTADPAALTLQLLNAQNFLVAAQNDLYTQWLSYLQQRISLYRDMGVMPLDSKGIWIEDVSHPHSSPPAEILPEPQDFLGGEIIRGQVLTETDGPQTPADPRGDAGQAVGPRNARDGDSRPGPQRGLGTPVLSSPPQLLPPAFGQAQER